MPSNIHDLSSLIKQEDKLLSYIFIHKKSKLKTKYYLLKIPNLKPTMKFMIKL